MFEVRNILARCFGILTKKQNCATLLQMSKNYKRCHKLLSIRWMRVGLTPEGIHNHHIAFMKYTRGQRSDWGFVASLTAKSVCNFVHPLFYIKQILSLNNDIFKKVRPFTVNARHPLRHITNMKFMKWIKSCVFFSKKFYYLLKHQNCLNPVLKRWNEIINGISQCFIIQFKEKGRHLF